MVEKGSTNSGKALPPFWAMPERNRFFLCEVVPKNDHAQKSQLSFMLVLYFSLKMAR